MAQTINNAEELDAFLDAWDGEVGAIRSNITLLKGTLAYSILFPKKDEVRGTTADQLPGAFEAIARMDTNWAKLQTCVSDARAARGNLPRWTGQKKAIDDIVAVFNTDSILMEVREIPLSQRTATSGDKLIIKASPTKLKEQINADFVKAKKVLIEIDEKWARINPSLGAARTKVQGLVDRFEAAGLGDATEVQNLVKRFNGVDSKYKFDPLGCPEDIEAHLKLYFTPAEDRLKGEEQRIQREREAVLSKLATAKQKSEELRVLRVKALELHAKAMSEIDNPQHYGLSAPGSVKRLTEWVTELEAKLAAHDYDGVSHGVDEWYVEYNALNRSLHEVIEANERVNKRRTDLLQRLAKATADYEAHKAKLGESKSLSTFARIAKESLTGKIKLDEAERAVESYEIKLAQLLAGIAKP